MSKKKAEPVYQLTSEKTLVSLLKIARNVGKKIREFSGEIGAAVANASEHHHLHRVAWSMIKTLDSKYRDGSGKLIPEKLAEFKAHFDHYWTKSGLEEAAESAPRLEMGDDPDGGKGEKGGSKVVPMRAAAEPAE